MREPGLAIAINVHGESIQQIKECFIRVARNLPRATVAIFLDGEERPDVSRVAEQLGFTVTLGKQLGTNRTWHLWWLRMLTFFDLVACDVCFKFDPDTMVDKSPQSIPLDPYFGDLHYTKEYDLLFIQGGISGLSLHTVRRILHEELLEPAPTKKWFTIPSRPGLAFADDQLLAAALKHIGISPVGWSECRSVWRHAILNDPPLRAIVHPRYY